MTCQRVRSWSPYDPLFFSYSWIFPNKYLKFQEFSLIIILENYMTNSHLAMQRTDSVKLGWYPCFWPKKHRFMYRQGSLSKELQEKKNLRVKPIWYDFTGDPSTLTNVHEPGEAARLGPSRSQRCKHLLLQYSLVLQNCWKRLEFYVSSGNSGEEKREKEKFITFQHGQDS